MRVLTVNVDEKIPERPQILQRHGMTVDERARAALGADQAANEAAVVLIESLLTQPRSGRVVGIAVEQHADLGTSRALANSAGVGAIAQRQSERIDEYGFSCAGLTGHDAHARLELELDLVDDGVVPDPD